MLPRAVFLGLAIVLSGCMARIPLLPPETPEAQQTDARPRLWYVGLGLYDETWSEGDVTAAATALSAHRSQEYQLEPIVLSYGAQHRYPFPDRANVSSVMTEIARRARPGDVVLLYVSTHGAPGLLARDADRKQLAPATIEEVGAWLAPLGVRPTVLILSACFSGSFIPGLRADNRIILAATRSDRTSFGCRAGAEHTVFGEALLDALATPATSLRTVVQRVRDQVAAKESDLRVTQPSKPQAAIGPAVASLYDAPIF